MKKENYPSECTIGKHEALYTKKVGYSWTEDKLTREYRGNICSDCDAKFEGDDEGLASVIKKIMDNHTPTVDNPQRWATATSGVWCPYDDEDGGSER